MTKKQTQAHIAVTRNMKVTALNEGCREHQ
jgi:hypothetical protein